MKEFFFKEFDIFVESDEILADPPEDLLTGVIKVSMTLRPVAFTYRGRYYDDARYWPASADCPWYSGVRSLSDWTSSSCRWRIWNSRRRGRDSRRISSVCGPPSRPGPPYVRWDNVAWRAPPVPGPPRRWQTRRRSCRRRVPSRPRARARAGSCSCSADRSRRDRRESSSHVDRIGPIFSSCPPDPASRRARRPYSRRARERPGYTARAFVGRRRLYGPPPLLLSSPRGSGFSSPSSRSRRSSWTISRRVSSAARMDVGIPSRQVARRRPRWRATSRRRWTWCSWRCQQGHTARVLCWRRRDVVAWCAADGAGDRGVSLSPRPPAPCRVSSCCQAVANNRNPPALPNTLTRPVRCAPLYYHCTSHTAILSVTDREARFSPAPTSVPPSAGCVAPSRTRCTRDTACGSAYTKNKTAPFCAVHWARVSVSLARRARATSPPRGRVTREWGKPKIHERAHGSCAYRGRTVRGGRVARRSLMRVALARASGAIGRCAIVRVMRRR